MPQRNPLRDYKASMFDPGDLAALGKWEEVFDYRVWSARLPLEAPQFGLFEMTPQGIVSIPQQRSRLLHLIRAGVPHHIASLFGYWAVSDADRLWLRVEWEGRAYYTIVMGGTPSAYRYDRMRWYCPECGTVLHEIMYETAQHGWRGLWDEEAKTVREFNSDPSLRTCRACGVVHPFAYSFFPEHDTPEAKEARYHW